MYHINILCKNMYIEREYLCYLDTGLVRTKTVNSKTPENWEPEMGADYLPFSAFPYTLNFLSRHMYQFSFSLMATGGIWGCGIKGYFMFAFSKNDLYF